MEDFARAQVLDSNVPDTWWGPDGLQIKHEMNGGMRHTTLLVDNACHLLVDVRFDVFIAGTK